MIPINWTSNIINNKEDKEAFTALLLNNPKIFNRLLDILKEREASYLTTLFSSSPPKEEELYTILGRIGETRELIKLLTIT